jgi:hypothetical protein
MKYKLGRVIVYSQFVILIIFFGLTIGNDILDIPHYLFGDSPTSMMQRRGEIFLEIFIFIAMIVIEYLFINYLLKRIRVLEGFLPICANCKKIRHQDNWEQLEEYIRRNSLAEFTHTICPECMKKLYPDFIVTKNADQ